MYVLVKGGSNGWPRFGGQDFNKYYSNQIPYNWKLRIMWIRQLFHQHQFNGLAGKWLNVSITRRIRKSATASHSFTTDCVCRQMCGQHLNSYLLCVTLIHTYCADWNVFQDKYTSPFAGWGALNDWCGQFRFSAHPFQIRICLCKYLISFYGSRFCTRPAVTQYGPSTNLKLRFCVLI